MRDPGVRGVHILYRDHQGGNLNILSSLPLSISCRLPRECVHKVGLDDSRLCVNVANKHYSETLAESVVVFVRTKTTRRSFPPGFTALCLAEQAWSRHVQLHEVPDVDEDAMQLCRVKNVDHLGMMLDVKIQGYCSKPEGQAPIEAEEIGR